MGDAVAISADDGAGRVHGTFPTGANHVHPEPQVKLSHGWIIVAADGFGGAVVPLRHESVPTTVVRSRNELPVYIGLFPCR